MIDKILKKESVQGSLETTPQNISKQEGPPPEAVLSDLKSRERVLNKLINEGHNTPNIVDLQKSLAAAIGELEKILESTEI